MPSTGRPSAYPRELAGTILNAFRMRSDAASLHFPSEAQLAELLDCVFLASIMREEGVPVQVRLRYVEPELCAEADLLRLSAPLPFSPDTLRKLSPATGPGIDVGVSPSDPNELLVWGFVYSAAQDDIRPKALSIKALLPGVIVGSVLERDLFLYANGETWTFDPHVLPISNWIARRQSAEGTFRERARVAVQLLSLAAASLRSGRGATLLIVPVGQPAVGLSEPRYAPDPSSVEVLSLAIRLNATQAVQRGVGKLAAIDGALVLDANGKLIGAGAMVNLTDPDDFRVTVVNAVDPSEQQETTLLTYPGGARHQAALRFCYANIGSWALVVSHDGVMAVITRQDQGDDVTVIRPIYAGMEL